MNHSEGNLNATKNIAQCLQYNALSRKSCPKLLSVARSLFLSADAKFSSQPINILAAL